MSPEEAAVVVAEVQRLLADGRFTDNGRGVTRPLTPADILVIAPYNMQVRHLRERLPAGVDAGTVDKFQGREAPVVFFSMATSSGEDAPHGREFLFSRNRLNVALSRARCLSVVVASPRLLDVELRTRWMTCGSSTRFAAWPSSARPPRRSRRREPAPPKPKAKAEPAAP